MSVDPALRRVTDADPEAVPPHLVAGIVDEHGREIRVAPFDAVGFPLDALFPFDEPVQQKPSEEA